MSMDVVLVVVSLAAIIAFMLGHVMTKNYYERAQYEANQNLKIELAKAVERQKTLERDYKEIASRIRAIGDLPSDVDANKLWQKIREQLSSDGQGKA